jgi:catechol 2,3-dioxygenase-like lactoylglutathione lyase family enzyme
LAINAIGHIGICVSDLERSLRFWRDGLGFAVLREFEFRASSWARILELDELDLRSKIIRRDHMTLELMQFVKPGAVGSTQRRPMNQLGLTHIAVWVSDLDAAAERVREYGGTIVQSTYTTFDHPKLKGRWVMGTDPDGVRVELLEYPAGEDVLER